MSNEQVRNLRSLVQEKAFHRATNSTEDLEKTCAAKTPTVDKVMAKKDEKACVSLLINLL